MNIKLDENLPDSLIADLSKLQHDVDSAVIENLSGYCDADVFNAAQAAGRFFITQDLDFSDIRSFKPGSHFGLLLLRLNNPSIFDLKQRLVEVFSTENVEAWSRSFVVVTDSKVRVRQP
jgi:predicted nuclease of predicted toxin-antitoxin system